MQEVGQEQVPQPIRKRKPKRLTTFNEEFDLSLFVIIAQKKWRWIALIFLIAIINALLYLRYAERIYEENTTIQIGSENTANKVLQGGANGLYQNNGDELAEATELMKSKLFMERVFRNLPMQVSYYTEGTFKNHEEYLNSPYVVSLDSDALAKLKNIRIYVAPKNLAGGDISFKQGATVVSYPYTTEEWTTTPRGKLKIHITNIAEIEKVQGQLKKSPYFFIINDYDALASSYSRQVNVRLLNPDAKTLQVSCRDYDDRKASDISNAMAEEFIRYDLEKRSKSAESVLSFIDEQLDVVYNKIKTTEGSLDTFQRNNKINPNQEAVTVNLTRLSNIQDQIATTDYEEKSLLHIENTLRTKKDVDPTELIGLMEGIDYSGSSITTNIATLHNMVQEKEHALYDATPNNQAVMHLNAEIDEQKQIVVKGIDAILAKEDTKKQDLESEANSIEKDYLSSSSGDNIEYLRLQRLFSIDEKYYDLLLEKKTEYSISKAGFVPESQILENSLPAWVPVSPQKSSTFFIAILAAISASVILLFIIYLFYNEITSIEEIERLAESPITILGIVPEYKKTIPVSQLIINNNPKSILAESFRSIRTNLQFVKSGENAKVISITSTISGEGKTFVSINLGAVIAYSGKKVIIIDLDMRRPRIHTALGLDNSKGMSTLLIGKYTIDEVVQQTETPNLQIITAGPIPPNPSELVISKEMDIILEKLKSKYDMVIIDNPPVGLVTDGIMMLQKADYPVYVMRADYSKREFIHFIDRLYFENEFHRLSIILNGVDLKKQAYSYGYYGYGYTYGQGSYYEA
jgi:capsular exopolysaccharide synthesis family protein